MSNFYIPTPKPEDWRPLLADPKKHWHEDHSAYKLAYSWQGANDFPEEVRTAFNSSNIELFNDIRLLFGFPEYKVPLPGGTQESQNDIFVIAKGLNQLVSIAVEGKVSEGFDKLVSDWRISDSKASGKEVRLKFLLNKLGLNCNLDNIRYQLLHRTVSAIIMAEELLAENALMLVHSFSQTYDGFNDYVVFLQLFGLQAKKDAIVGSVRREKVNLYFGWVRG
jgi:hypothetical protein